MRVAGGSNQTLHVKDTCRVLEMNLPELYLDDHTGGVGDKIDDLTVKRTEN